MEPKKKLLLIDELPGQQRLPGFLTRSQADLCRGWLEQSSAHRAIVPPGVPEALAPELRNRVLTWWDVKNMADCQNETFDDMFAFHDRVFEILGVRSGNESRFARVARSLKYGFITPFAEDFPFLVSGLHSYFDREDFGTVVRIEPGCSSFGAAAEQVALARGLRVDRRARASSILLHGAFRAASWLGFHVRWAKELFVTSSRYLALRTGANPRGAVLAVVNKVNSYRYMAPLEERAKAAGLPIVYYDLAVPVPPGKAVGLRWQPRSRAQALAGLASFLAFSLRAFLAWPLAYPRIRALEHRYRGVRIAPFHAAHLKQVLLLRGGRAAFTSSVLAREFSENPPSALFLLDPLEGSAVAAAEARRKKIKSLFYYSISNGLISTAVLWERSAPRSTSVVTINDWMVRRADEARLSEEGAPEAIGDILQQPFRPETRDRFRGEIAEKFGLDEKVPWIVLLTRPVSSVLSASDREELIRQAAEAANEHGAALIVKGHPHEAQNELRRMVAAYWKTPVVLIQEYLLEDVLSTADLVISSPASSAALYAYYLRRPVILFGPEQVFADFDRIGGLHALRGNGAGEILYSGDSLVPLAGQLLRDPERRNAAVEKGLLYLRKVRGSSDALAANRLVERLASLAGTAARPPQAEVPW